MPSAVFQNVRGNIQPPLISVTIGEHTQVDRLIRNAVFSGEGGAGNFDGILCDRVSGRKRLQFRWPVPGQIDQNIQRKEIFVPVLVHDKYVRLSGSKPESGFYHKIVPFGTVGRGLQNLQIFPLRIAADGLLAAL